MPKHRSSGGDGAPHKKSRGDKHKRRHRHHGEGKKKSHGGGGGQRSEEPADDTAPAPTFDALNLKPALLRGIYAFGFERPSAIQQRAIRPIVRGRDVIAQSQSGTVSLLLSILLGSRIESFRQSLTALFSHAHPIQQNRARRPSSLFRPFRCWTNECRIRRLLSSRPPESLPSRRSASSRLWETL